MEERKRPREAEAEEALSEKKKQRAADVSDGKRFQLWGTQCTASQRSEMLLDDVAIYSVTDARTADRITKIALGLEGGPFREVCDGCACVGGNVVSFARAVAGKGGAVSGIEVDETRFEFLKHNVRTAGLEAECLCADVASATAKEAPAEEGAAARPDLGAARAAVRRAELLFLDPPWGGPEVSARPMGSVSFAMSGVDLGELCVRCAAPDFATKHVLLKLPPNYNTDKLKADVADVADVRLEVKLRKMILAIVSFRSAPAGAEPDARDDGGEPKPTSPTGEPKPASPTGEPKPAAPSDTKEST